MSASLEPENLSQEENIESDIEQDDEQFDEEYLEYETDGAVDEEYVVEQFEELFPVSLEDTAQMNLYESPDIELQPPSTKTSTDYGPESRSTSAPDVIHLDDFRGLNLTIPISELPVKTKYYYSVDPEVSNVGQFPSSDENIVKPFQVGDQEVHLLDFRGLQTSKLDITEDITYTEELGEDDISQGWNILGAKAISTLMDPPHSHATQLDLQDSRPIIRSPSEIMEIPEVPAREALSRTALTDDVMDPTIRHLEMSANQDPHETETESVLYRCPSLISSLKGPKADVFIYLYPEHRMISRECRMDVTIYQIKQAVSRYIRVTPEQLELKRHKHVCHDERNLLELGAKPNTRVLFEVDVNKRLAFAENRNALQRMEDYEPKVLQPRPDTIRRVTCMVKDESGLLTRKHQLVTIVHPTMAKPMIGGYYDKKADVTYHHAATLTDQETQSISCTSTEACQTHSDKHLWTQTNVEKANQTVRPDLFLSDAGDRVVYARRHYVSAAEIKARRIHAAIVIQTYWRRWLAIRERRRRVIELVKQVEWIENIRKERIEMREKLIQEELERQLNPTNLLDLELLYRAINKWRNEQTEYVYANRWGVERKAALAQLAEMEADLLQNLDKVRNRIISKNEEKRKQKQFLKMGQPQRWLGYKSLFVSYDTDGRLLARYLHSLYKSLTRPVISTPEGIQNRLILLEEITEQVKKGEKALKCKNMSKMPRHLIDMIHDLIGREMRFISTKCSAGLLSATRQRIANTFFCLCRDPYFNPEAKRCDPVPYNRQKLGQMVACKGCMRIRSKDSFTIIKGTTVTQTCQSCSGLYRTAILRSDLNLFRQLLKQLRQEEFKVGIVNSVTSLLDANDIKFLFEQIWGGQSALSGIDNRYVLSLCRWQKNEPWAPWNSVLFTDEEAAIHQELENFEQAYQPTFLHKIAVQQARARLYFADLAKYSMKLDYEMAKLSCESVMPPEEVELGFSSQFAKKQAPKRSRRVKGKR